MDQRITELINQLNKSPNLQRTGRSIEVGHYEGRDNYYEAPDWVVDGYEAEDEWDYSDRNAAHAELVKIGKAVNPFLTDILTRDTDYPHYQSQDIVCATAYDVLLETGDYETIKNLIPQLKTKSDHLSHTQDSTSEPREGAQVHAMIRLMGHFRVEEAVSLLSSLVEECTDNRKWFSIESLAKIGTEEAITSLSRSREKGDYDLRRITIHNIREIYDQHSRKDARIRAGEELGYSNLRIWFHELFR